MLAVVQCFVGCAAGTVRTHHDMLCSCAETAKRMHVRLALHTQLVHHVAEAAVGIEQLGDAPLDVLGFSRCAFSGLLQPRVLDRQFAHRACSGSEQHLDGPHRLRLVPRLPLEQQLLRGDQGQEDRCVNFAHLNLSCRGAPWTRQRRCERACARARRGFGDSNSFCRRVGRSYARACALPVWVERRGRLVVSDALGGGRGLHLLGRDRAQPQLL
mmetsp:Transcript_18310/g.46824  ORF Transcript_18310/g.46824 Transcript_18310/m.46824 type:complete len:214 (-) Transcript_18310:227-868(-)